MFIVIAVFLLVRASASVFHENTAIRYSPERNGDYFGYSVVLKKDGLFIGAPKSKNVGKWSNISSGLVYSCSLDGVVNKANNKAKCVPYLPYKNDLGDFFQDDMWYGASMGVIFDKLIINAPRYRAVTTESLPSDRHFYYQLQGAAYYEPRERLAYYLADTMFQMHTMSKSRPGFEQFYGESVFYYAQGQAGMSVKVIKEDKFVLGAPGLLEWSGSCIYCTTTRQYLGECTTILPEAVEGLAPADYYGYSVDSGVFQKYGKTLILGGAPRARGGKGKVLLLEVDEIMIEKKKKPKIVKKLEGEQLGAYFGGSICCVDINRDGLTDILVGAPNYANKGDGIFDQGAVFVYMTKKTSKNFNLEKRPLPLTGSGANGARFGTTIASLGDIDGDGCNDVAIAAPWENGRGAVYIYRGFVDGIREQYVQRLAPEGVSAFGISISAGLDIDSNGCNDVAIGAAASKSVHLYRCVPPVVVHAYIQVPDATNLPQNTTNFTANFCVSAEGSSHWPMVEAGVKMSIELNPKDQRASLTNAHDSRGSVTVRPGSSGNCVSRTIQIKPKSDLSTPIVLKLCLEADDIMKENATVFNTKAGRIARDSKMSDELAIQVNQHCGDDKICTPFLRMSLKPFYDPYIPGITKTLGAYLTIVNEQEPAYKAKVKITLPATPISTPSSCTLEGSAMTCDVPSPLSKNESESWDIKLIYEPSNVTEMKIVAEIQNSIYKLNITDEYVKEVTIRVTPIATFDVKGISSPNIPLLITRQMLSDSEVVAFEHGIQITNDGPSDWFSLGVKITLPEMVTLNNTVDDCELDSAVLSCNWFVQAKVPLLVNLPLLLDLGTHGNTLNSDTAWNLTTLIQLDAKNGNTSTDITTSLVIEQPTPVWPALVGVVAGVIVFAILIYLLHRCGFFSRAKREELKKLKRQTLEAPTSGEDQPGTSAEPDGYESTIELLDDSDH